MIKLSKFSFLMVAALLASNACGHGGGQDSNGGHVDRSTGEYHCHADNCVLPGSSDEDVLDPPDGVDDGPITVAGSWGTTKKWARDTIYEGLDTTFYCGYDGSDQSHSVRSVVLEQANALRSNKRYGLIDNEVRLLGACDFEWSDDLAEPTENKRGDVARVWLYYVSRHGLQLHDGQD